MSGLTDATAIAQVDLANWRPPPVGSQARPRQPALLRHEAVAFASRSRWDVRSATIGKRAGCLAVKPRGDVSDELPHVLERRDFADAEPHPKGLLERHDDRDVSQGVPPFYVGRRHRGLQLQVSDTHDVTDDGAHRLQNFRL